MIDNIYMCNSIYIWGYKIVMLLLLITTGYYYKKNHNNFILVLCFACYNLAIYLEFVAYLLNAKKSITFSTYSSMTIVSELITVISHVLLYLGIVRLIRANRKDGGGSP